MRARPADRLGCEQEGDESKLTVDWLVVDTAYWVRSEKKLCSFGWWGVGEVGSWSVGESNFDLLKLWADVGP